jgi:hypothetical protein
MRTLAPAVLLFACAVAHAAEPSAFQHFKYAVPPGWKESRYANAVLLAPTDPPKGHHLDLTLMMPKPHNGTLPEALATSWDDVCLQSGLTKKRTVNNMPYDIQTEERTCYKGWKYIRARGEVVGNADQAEYDLNLTVIRIFDRIERVAVLGRKLTHNVTRYSLYDSPTHQQVVNQFLFSLQFDDWIDDPVKPATLDGGGIIGAWNGVGLFGGQYKSAYVIFFSNNQVFYGSRFPHEGLHKFDTWLDAELTPRYWGTYSFSNGAGTISMPTGKFPFKTTDAGLTITPIKVDHKYVRLAPVDDATFAGAYAAEPRGNVVPTITFTAQGRFDDDGALGVLDHTAAFPFKLTAPPGRGSYSVKDHTILFSYDDGRRFPVAFAGHGYDKSNPSPPTLEMSWNDDTLKRR